MAAFALGSANGNGHTDMKPLAFAPLKAFSGVRFVLTDTDVRRSRGTLGGDRRLPEGNDARTVAHGGLRPPVALIVDHRRSDRRPCADAHRKAGLLPFDRPWGA